MPSAFWLGLVLIFLAFAVLLAVAAGQRHGHASYAGGEPARCVGKHLILPAANIGGSSPPAWWRGSVAHNHARCVLRQDYVRTARAKGLRERQVDLSNTPVKRLNALVNVVPVIGHAEPGSCSAARFTSRRYSNGRVSAGMLVNAIATRDILLVQGGVLVVAVCYVLFNLMADIVQHLLDPRLKT